MTFRFELSAFPSLSIRGWNEKHFISHHTPTQARQRFADLSLSRTPVGYNVSSVMLDLRDMVSCGEATPRFLTLGTAYLFLRRVVVP